MPLLPSSPADRIEEYWEWMAVALFLLIPVDLLTTLAAARVTGPSAEANPLVRWLLGQPVWLFVAVNLGAVVLVGVLFYGVSALVRRMPDHLARPFALLVEVWLGALIAAGLAVLANNLAVIALGESLL